MQNETLNESVMSTNMSLNVTSNSTEDGIITQGLLTGLCIFSALTVLVNSMILIASKYTTAGKSAILVFMRSLCVADLLIGLFGMFKTLILMHHHHSWINCYLPDSLFTSASITICLTLLWLNIDSYLRLTRPFGYGNSMDKGSVIIAMLLVWNGGFIIGFLPQLGWNMDEYGCNFFTFYSVIYISLISVIWISCMVGGLMFQVYIRRILRRIQQDVEFVTSNSAQYALYSQLVRTIGNDMIVLVVCYLPFLIYICKYFIKARYEDTNTASEYMIYFIPVFQCRSFFCAFLHSYQTIKLQSLTPNRQGSIVKLFRGSNKPKHSKQTSLFYLNGNKTNFQSDNRISNSHSLDFLDVANRMANGAGHRKLHQTNSNTTIMTVVDSHCSGSGRTSNSSSMSSRHTRDRDGGSRCGSLASINELQHVTVTPTVTTQL